MIYADRRTEEPPVQQANELPNFGRAENRGLRDDSADRALEPVEYCRLQSVRTAYGLGRIRNPEDALARLRTAARDFRVLGSPCSPRTPTSS